MERATAEFGHLRFVVVDLGQHACSTTGACFWLCLAAGLSVSDWHIDAQALPGIADCESLLAEIRQSAPHVLDRAPSNDIEHSAVGRLAYRLRQYMCAGAQPAMLRQSMMRKIYAGFAGAEVSDQRVRRRACGRCLCVGAAHSHCMHTTYTQWSDALEDIILSAAWGAIAR